MERGVGKPTTLYRIFRQQAAEGHITVTLKDGLQGKRRVFGIVESNNRISIKKDQPKKELVITLFHEMLHVRYPNKNEDVIEEQAMNMYDQLTPGQIGFFEFIIEKPPEIEIVSK